MATQETENEEIVRQIMQEETIEIPGNATHRVNDGRITETWATWNFLGALGQLGVTELPMR